MANEIIYVCNSTNNKNVRSGELNILEKHEENLYFQFGEDEMNIKKRFYNDLKTLNQDFNALIALKKSLEKQVEKQAEEPVEEPLKEITQGLLQIEKIEEKKTEKKEEKKETPKKKTSRYNKKRDLF